MRKPDETARTYLERCLMALRLEVAESIVDEIRKAASDACAEANAVGISDYNKMERATAIAAGIMSREPQHRPRDLASVAREALAVVSCIVSEVEGSAKPTTGDAPLRDIVDGGENPVHCEFHRVRHGMDALIYEARFEMSNKSVHVMPRADRERLLKIMIVDALDAAIKIEDL